MGVTCRGLHPRWWRRRRPATFGLSGCRGRGSGCTYQLLVPPSRHARLCVGGALLLPFAAFAVARPRRGCPHAPAAAAAPHRLHVPVPASVGGAGRGGATRGGRFQTAAELGWPPPTSGRQRPVLLAHPSHQPNVLVLPQHPDGHSAPLFLFSRRDAPCFRPYSPTDGARPTASRGSRDLGTLASATNAACLSSLVARARHGAS